MGQKSRSFSSVSRLLPAPPSFLLRHHPSDSRLSTSVSSCSNPKGGAFEPGLHPPLVPSTLTSLFSTSSFDPGSGARCTIHVDSAAQAFSGVGRSVISVCSHLWEKKDDSFFLKSSLQDVINLGLDLSPETLRRFWRVSALEPEDFPEILLGFGPDLNLRKVEFLWQLFRWAAAQRHDFRHLPSSYEQMVSMLAGAYMLEEAESLLLSLDTKNVSVDAATMYSDIIQGYAGATKSEKSMSLHDQARAKDLAPSASCYQALLNLLIKMGKSEQVLRVYKDMLEVGFGLHTNEQTLDFIVEALTKNEKIVEAINIIRYVKSYGIEASHKGLSMIAEGFCRKRDFGDMLNFLEEWGHIPEPRICNKMLSCLCLSLGTKEAWPFVQRMEMLGFVPDATTFAISICQSCSERKLRPAFVYLSENFSRNIAPKVSAYNAIISGVFKEGLYRHARHVFEDMVEKGVVPDLSTFRTLLAGYCLYKRFDDVEHILSDISKSCMVSLAPGECTISKALMFLGLDYLQVKVKRDNDPRLPKADFFDSLGNGLYLETDMNKYEACLREILDGAMLPDFNSALLLACQARKMDGALQVKDEIIQWGQNISLSAYSELLKALCACPGHTKQAMNVFEEMKELGDQLDSKTLNLLIRTLIRGQMTSSARLVLERLFKIKLMVEKDTYADLIIGFCKEGNMAGFRECWELAKRDKWSPGKKEIRILLSCFCKRGMIREVLGFLDNLAECYPDLVLGSYTALLKELCSVGCTSVGCAILEAILKTGLIVERSVFLMLTKGFLKEQKQAEALGMFNIWVDKNTFICAGVYRLILPVLLRYGNIERAMNLRQLVQSKHLGPDNFVYNTLTNELLCKGKTKEAAFVLQEMIQKKMPLSVLDTFLQRCCRDNNWSKASEVLCFMLRMHSNLSISSYRGLVRQMCVRRWFLGALRLKDLIREMNKPGEHILHNILIFRLFQTRNILLVEHVLKDMQDRNIAPDKVTYDFLVYGFHKCRSLSKSVEALSTAISKGMIPSAHSLRIGICYFCSQGNVDKALELHHFTEQNSVKHGSVIDNSIALSLLSLGRHSEAKRFLGRLNKREKTLVDTSYDVLVKQLCIKGDINMATDLLNMMLKNGSLPNELSYSSLIQGLCTCKSFDQALDLLAEAQFKKLKLHKESYKALVYGLCAVGRIGDAKGILEAMRHLGSIPTYDMYSHVIDKYYATNNLESALELLHELQQVGYSPNFETHWSLISNLSVSRNKTHDNGRRFLSDLLSGRSLQAKRVKYKGSLALKCEPP